MLLVRAINSVINQTHRKFKHIIINDGGDNVTFGDVISQFKSAYGERLVTIINAEPQGTVKSLNIGVRAAAADYVAVHDDDDSWDPQFLQKMIAALKERQRHIPITRGVVSLCTLINEEISGKDIIEKYRYSWNGWLREVRIVQLCMRNFITPISFLCEDSVFAEVGLFDESLEFGEDWDFYLRFVCSYEIAVLREHLAYYHQRRVTRGAYGNTVTEKLDKHVMFGALMRNQWIRRDIKSGKPSLGAIIALTERSARFGPVTPAWWTLRHKSWAALRVPALAKRFRDRLFRTPHAT